ncbi:MAG: 50S ribosomal protein L24 [Candidatus Omnitrophota bacterium]|nr:50S ribosomal protein L24 [Candidatus Omnitrophota bacterium]
MKHLKRDDLVIAITGKEKGKTGKVLKVFSQGRVIVQGLAMVKKASRPNKVNPQGGIIEREGSIHLSNLKLFCPKCKQPARTGRKFLSNKAKVRICKKCGEII